MPSARSARALPRSARSARAADGMPSARSARRPVGPLGPRAADCPARCRLPALPRCRRPALPRSEHCQRCRAGSSARSERCRNALRCSAFDRLAAREMRCNATRFMPAREMRCNATPFAPAPRQQTHRAHARRVDQRVCCALRAPATRKVLPRQRRGSGSSRFIPPQRHISAGQSQFCREAGMPSGAMGFGAGQGVFAGGEKLNAAMAFGRESCCAVRVFAPYPD
jgi:hypothetical protein